MDKRIITIGSLVALVFAQSCMLSPADGDAIATRGTSVHFEGYDSLSNNRVDVQVFNPTTGVWDLLGSDSTATSPTHYDGSDYYQFVLDRLIPSADWVAGAKSGYFSHVRALRADGTRLTSVVPDWASCSGRWSSVGQFLTHCDGVHSPEAYVFTSSYPTGTDMVLTDFHISPSGLWVDVTNAGRDGIIEQVDCEAAQHAVSASWNLRMLPGERHTFLLSFSWYPGSRYTCNVVARNLDGSAEAVTSDNFRAETL